MEVAPQPKKCASFGFGKFSASKTLLKLVHFSTDHQYVQNPKKYSYSSAWVYGVFQKEVLLVLNVHNSNLHNSNVYSSNLHNINVHNSKFHNSNVHNSNGHTLNVLNSNVHN